MSLPSPRRVFRLKLKLSKLLYERLSFSENRGDPPNWSVWRPLVQVRSSLMFVLGVGPGGDSIRVGHGSVWLSNLSQQNVWRFTTKQP